jgi:hypothetical protein
MPVPNVGGPGQTDGQPIRETGEQVGGKGADGNFHIFSTDNFGFLNVNTTGGGGTVSENLTQVGGVNITLGQKTMALSFPVVIASDQSAIPVTGTVISNQGTPNSIANSWPVEITDGTNILGTATHPVRIDPTGTTVQPVSGSVSVSGTVAVTQSTSPWVTNLTQWASTVLGTPTNFGTSPGAVIVGSVNASLFSGTTALTNTGGSLNVNLTSGTVTITGAVSGSLTNNNAAPAANNIGILPAIAETAYTTVTYTTGNQVLPVTDLHGALNQDLQAYAGTQLTGTVTAYGTAPTGNVFGVNAFITNTVPVTLASTTITGTVAVTQSTSPWVVSLASTTITNTVAENLIQVAGVTLGATAVVAYGSTPAAANVPAVNAFVTNTVAVTLTSTTVTNTVAENLTQVAGVVLGATAVTAFGTAPAAANVPGVNASLFSGTTALTNTGGALNVNITNAAGPFTVGGDETNNNAAPDNTMLGVLPAVANAASPAWTEGFNVLESVDLTGRQRVRGTLTHNNAAPVADGQMTLTHLANAAAPSYTEGNVVLASCDLAGNTRVIGTKTNNNAAPTTQIGVMPAVANAAAPSWTEGNQVLLSVDLSGNLRTLPTTLVGTLTNNNAAPGANNVGVLGFIAESAYTNLTYTTGDQVLAATDLKGAVNTDLQAVAGTAVVTAAAGVQKVGIVGNTGAVLDAVITAATAPANGQATLGVYNSTAPALTTGQSVAVQLNSAGDLFVKPYRRSETAPKATTISNTTATTVVSAPAAGFFADISNLVITPTPAPSIALAFTATLSDGTNSYIFDLDTGVVANTGGSNALALLFNPPLKATTAATAWTLALSATTITVHVTTNAVLQTAS